MIESYESAEVRSMDLDEIEARVRRLGEEWDRHGAELHRLHPEVCLPPRPVRVVSLPPRRAATAGR